MKYVGEFLDDQFHGCVIFYLPSRSIYIVLLLGSFGTRTMTLRMVGKNSLRNGTSTTAGGGLVVGGSFSGSLMSQIQYGLKGAKVSVTSFTAN